MTFEQYRKLTIKTMSDTGSKIGDSAHMTLGINTEIMGEFPEAMQKMDLVNFKEELGDAMWYVANFCNIWGIDPELLVPLHEDTKGMMELSNNEPDQFVLVFGLGVTTAHLQDIDKKEFAYGKPGDLAKRTELINTIYTGLVHYAYLLGIDIEAVYDTNIEKLSSRYPGLTFDADRANTRDLDVERGILEQGK